MAGRFVRTEPRRTAGLFVEGLLSGVERKTCWPLAERAGYPDPQAIRRLLCTAVWDADAVRDDVRDWLIEWIGHPDGALVADKIGFLNRLAATGVRDQVRLAVKPAMARQMITAVANAGVPAASVTGEFRRPRPHVGTGGRPLHWSIWRRTSHARARRSHYQGRQTK